MRDVKYDGDIEWIKEEDDTLYKRIKELSELYIDIQNNSEYSVEAGLELEYLIREAYNPWTKLCEGKQEISGEGGHAHCFAEAVYMRYFAPTVSYGQAENIGRIIHIFKTEDSAVLVKSHNFKKALEEVVFGFKQPLVKLKPMTADLRKSIQKEFESDYFDNKLAFKDEVEETVMGKPKKVTRYKTVVLVD